MVYGQYNPSLINDDKKITYEPEIVILLKNMNLLKEIETFLKCVSNKEDPITIDEALNVQIVLNMIEKKLKGIPIRIY